MSRTRYRHAGGARSQPHPGGGVGALALCGAATSPPLAGVDRLVVPRHGGGAGADVWLYNNTGRSVCATALFHMTINVAWQLFPVHGSYFDPRSSGVITALIAVIIVGVWGPRTLTRAWPPA